LKVRKSFIFLYQNKELNLSAFHIVQLVFLLHFFHYYSLFIRVSLLINFTYIFHIQKPLQHDNQNFIPKNGGGNLMFRLSVFVLLLATTGVSIAQNNCGVSLGIDCYPQNPIQQFKCIDANQHPNVSYWIQQGMMQSYANSATTPQFLIIKGHLQIPVGSLPSADYNFAPSSEIIFADAASGIQVLTGASLVINSSYLHGCNSMWHSLRAGSHASIIAYNSTIEDARYAIWGWADNSIIRAIGNTFKRNYASIVFGDQIVNGPVYNYYSDGICGNTFIGQGQDGFGQPWAPQLLSNPWGFSAPAAGIVIEAPRNTIKIGEESALMNEFKNFQGAVQNGRIYGILSIDANVDVVNSRIACNSVPNQSDDRFGIYSQSSTGTHLLTVKGLGSGTPMFENLYWGIACISNRIEIQDAFFLKNRFCIGEYYGNNSAPIALAPTTCKVKNCRFEDYYDVGVAVVGLQPLMISQLQITDNEFVDGNIALISSQSNHGFGDRFAIRIFSLATAELVNGNISDNVITCNSKHNLDWKHCSNKGLEPCFWQLFYSGYPGWTVIARSKNYG